MSNGHGVHRRVGGRGQVAEAEGRKVPPGAVMTRGDLRSSGSVGKRDLRVDGVGNAEREPGVVDRPSCGLVGDIKVSGTVAEGKLEKREVLKM